MKKLHVPGIIAMAMIVVASNILVQFLILDGLLTWGTFTYPFAFLVTDVMNRIYGPASARRTIVAGFFVGIICSLIGTQITLQGDGYTYPAVSLRIAVGSALAFLVGQLADVAIFDRLRNGSWWRAPAVSSFFGSALDSTLFYTISFASFITIFGPDADAQINWGWESAPFMTVGPNVPLWISLGLADWLVKMPLAMLALLPFRAIVERLSTETA